MTDISGISDISSNTYISHTNDIEKQNTILSVSFAEMRAHHINSQTNARQRKRIDNRIIDRSLELVDISNIGQNLKKKIKLKINDGERAFLRLDTLDPLNMSDDELDECSSMIGHYKKISYTQVRDSINHL